MGFSLPVSTILAGLIARWDLAFPIESQHALPVSKQNSKSPSISRVTTTPILRGLHHEYEWAVELLDDIIAEDTCIAAQRVCPRSVPE
jgi:hypothetical protein